MEDAADSVPKRDTSQEKPQDKVKEQPSTCSPKKVNFVNSTIYNFCQRISLIASAGVASIELMSRPFP